MSPKRLSPEQKRRIFELKSEGWKQKDIAKELDIPESTISVFLSREKQAKRKVKVVGVKKDTMYLIKGQKVASIALRFPLDLLVEYNNLVELGAVEGSFEDWVLGHLTRKDRLSADLQVAMDSDSIELRKQIQRKNLQRTLERADIDAEMMDVIRLAKAAKELDALE